MRGRVWMVVLLYGGAQALFWLGSRVFGVAGGTVEYIVLAVAGNALMALAAGMCLVLLNRARVKLGAIVRMRDAGAGGRGA